MDGFANTAIKAAHYSSLNSTALRFAHGFKPQSIIWMHAGSVQIPAEFQLFMNQTENLCAARLHEYAISTNISLSRWRSMDCCCLEDLIPTFQSSYVDPLISACNLFQYGEYRPHARLDFILNHIPTYKMMIRIMFLEGLNGRLMNESWMGMTKLQSYMQEDDYVKLAINN